MMAGVRMGSAQARQINERRSLDARINPGIALPIWSTESDGRNTGHVGTAPVEGGFERRAVAKRVRLKLPIALGSVLGGG